MSESATAEAIDTAAPAAPVDASGDGTASTAAPETAATTQTPAADAGPDYDAEDDRILAEISAKNADPSAPSGRARDDRGRFAKADEAAPAAPTGTTPAQAHAGQPAASTAQQQKLTDDEREILRRFKLEEADAPANPERRAKFIANLRERHEAQANLYRQWQQAQQQRQQQAPASAPPPQQQQQQSAQQDDPEAELRAAIGEDLYPTLAKVIEAKVEARVKPLSERHQAEDARRQQQEAEAFKASAERGLDAVRKQLPHVDLADGSANLTRLAEHAAALLKGSPNFTPEQALTKAALSEFHEELILAERKKLATSQHKAFAGSPAPGGGAARTQPAPSTDDLETELAQAITRGATADEREGIQRRLNAAYAAQGQGF